jgi:hypothetical protein
MQIELIRLKAEMSDKTMVIPKDYAINNPDLVQSEEALYTSRQKELHQLKQALASAQKEYKFNEAFDKKRSRL